MNKKKLVICNKAGVCDYCTKGCIHSEPHELDAHICTQWGECCIEDKKGNEVYIKVRCVQVKD